MENVLSGVPQGSVLGPLLFTTYINDIDESIACRLLKFAYDTKLYLVIESTKDVESLQVDLANLVLWPKEWQMLLGMLKVEFFSFCIWYIEQMSGLASP